ncbi:MAG: hypothetical protein ACRD1K_02035, partial [Acidimicrobiales bacterium]
MTPRPRRIAPLRHTIAGRLLGWFLAMALLPLGVAVVVTSRMDTSKLAREGRRLVAAAAEAKAADIERLVVARRDAALALARTPAAADGYRRLVGALASGGVDSTAYAVEEASLRPFFSRYLRDFGFADLFLVSARGEGVFAVNETDGLGFNYETGPFRGTGRAAAFARVRDTGSTALFGFDAFSVNQRGAYVAVPLAAPGTEGAVAVFEVDKDEIFAVVGDHGGLG